MITRLQLGLGHLRDHKFKNSFQDCLNPLCSCGVEVETTVHYLLHCPNYLMRTLMSNIKPVLMSNIKPVLPNVLEQNESFISDALLLMIPLPMTPQYKYPKYDNQLYMI